MANKFNAGKNIKQNEYESFSPSFVNKSFEWEDKRIDLLLADAMRYLGELNAYSKLIPDVDYFIKMHIAKEATASSVIEGTNTNLDEALTPALEVSPEKKDDWQEVQNYIKAINFAIKELTEDGRPPFSVRLLKDAHKILLDGVRGFSKLPGEVRRSQNWIGGHSLKDAVYIPPYFTEVPELLGDLDKFWHNKELNIPDLVKIAIGHYQFESIHPFLDGNGRIGRLAIVLHLVSLGILQRPTLYISEFFEKNRRNYYDALSRVRTANDIEQWLRFFLNGIAETARKAKENLEKIIDLRKKYEESIESMGIKRQKLAKELLKRLFSNPIVTINDITELVPMTFPTANAIAKDFEVRGIFTEKTGRKKDRVFYLREYIDIFNS